MDFKVTLAIKHGPHSSLRIKKPHKHSVYRAYQKFSVVPPVIHILN